MSRGGRPRPFALIVAAFLAVLLAPVSTAPAGAVETAQFGLVPGPPGPPSRHLVEQVRPGHATSDALLLFNKTAAPLTLTLAVLPASVAANGAPQVGGSDQAVGWIELDRREVRLPGGAAVPVRFKVHAPRQLPAGKLTVAISAVPTAIPGQNVAVLNRLALLVTIEGKPGASLSASLGVIAWVAVGLLVLVALAVAWRAARRRKRS